MKFTTDEDPSLEGNTVSCYDIAPFSPKSPKAWANGLAEIAEFVSSHPNKVTSVEITDGQAIVDWERKATKEDKEYFKSLFEPTDTDYVEYITAEAKRLKLL